MSSLRCSWDLFEIFTQVITINLHNIDLFVSYLCLICVLYISHYKLINWHENMVFVNKFSSLLSPPSSSSLKKNLGLPTAILWRFIFRPRRNAILWNPLSCKAWLIVCRMFQANYWPLYNSNVPQISSRTFRLCVLSEAIK